MSTRSKAKALGHSIYWRDVQPCVNGHICFSYVDGGCVECKSERESNKLTKKVNELGDALRNLRIPKWRTQADKQAIKAIYQEAKKLREETGLDYVVDHILPLVGKTVSGLHVSTNLQIILRVDNAAKGNKIV